MNVFIKTILADKILKYGFILSFIIIALTIGYILFFYRSLPPFIPIFNQLQWGEPRLAEKIMIFLPTIITVVLAVVNLFLSSILYKKMPLVSRMLCITSLLLSLINLTFTFRNTQLVL